MDFERVRENFKKRYNRACDNIFFVGKNIVFFEGGGITLSGCVGMGEAMAFGERSDGRVTVQFSDNNDMTSFNINELGRHKDDRVARLYIKAEKCGIKTKGADIFIAKNSGTTDLLEPLFLGGFSVLCENAPQKERLLPRFENYEKNLMALSGRKKAVTMFDGMRLCYFDFFKGEVKIVIICAKSARQKGTCPQNAFSDDIAASLARGDAEGFCKLLEKYSRQSLLKNKNDKQKNLFSAAAETKDALGCGTMPGGGIFSIVKNEKIDSFIYGVTHIYQKHFGGTPDFYVADLEDSGFFVN